MMKAHTKLMTKQPLKASLWGISSGLHIHSYVGALIGFCLSLCPHWTCLCLCDCNHGTSRWFMEIEMPNFHPVDQGLRPYFFPNQSKQQMFNDPGHTRKPLWQWGFLPHRDKNMLDWWSSCTDCIMLTLMGFTLELIESLIWGPGGNFVMMICCMRKVLKVSFMLGNDDFLAFVGVRHYLQ